MKRVLFLLLLVTAIVSAQAGGIGPQLNVHHQELLLQRATEQDLLWDQFDDAGDLAGWTAQNFEVAFDAYDNEIADDFVVPTGESWTIEQILVAGIYEFCCATPPCANCGPATSV